VSHIFIEQAVPYDIRELLGFQREPRNKWMCMEAHWKFFLEYEHGRRPSMKKFYPEPHHPRVSLMDVQKILGRIRETKITNTELNWLYSALIARQPTVPTHLMVRGVTSPCWLSL
jgi:hypothetical protein